MGRISAKRRHFEIKQKHKRKEKLAKLRKAYAEAKTEKEKKKILAKVWRIAPQLSEEEFLKPVKEKKQTNSS